VRGPGWEPPKIGPRSSPSGGTPSRERSAPARQHQKHDRVCRRRRAGAMGAMSAPRWRGQASGYPVTPPPPRERPCPTELPAASTLPRKGSGVVGGKWSPPATNSSPGPAARTTHETRRSARARARANSHGARRDHEQRVRRLQGIRVGGRPWSACRETRKAAPAAA